MANFAEIDENNIVIRVLSVDDSKKENGQEYLANELGLGGTWIETSYENEFRGNYASPGDYYDPENDIFVPTEHGLTSYLMAWNGNTQPTTPSIMIDGVARSGNIFLSACVNKAFPNAFQRWGYEFQHNAATFSLSNFDIIVVPVRDPLDSAGSWIAMTGTSEMSGPIEIWLNEAEALLNTINQNKERLKIVKFEDFTTNPNATMQSIAQDLNVSAVTVNVQEVESDLEVINQVGDNFYSLPAQNKAEIESIKQMLLDTPEYAAKIQTLQAIYNNIIS
jgi:hypothetical protein